jgi:hypothetical protein
MRSESLFYFKNKPAFNSAMVMNLHSVFVLGLSSHFLSVNSPLNFIAKTRCCHWRGHPQPLPNSFGGRSP